MSWPGLWLNRPRGGPLWPHWLPIDPAAGTRGASVVGAGFSPGRPAPRDTPPASVGSHARTRCRPVRVSAAAARRASVAEGPSPRLEPDGRAPAGTTVAHRDCIEISPHACARRARLGWAPSGPTPRASTRAASGLSTTASRPRGHPRLRWRRVGGGDSYTRSRSEHAPARRRDFQRKPNEPPTTSNEPASETVTADSGHY